MPDGFPPFVNPFADEYDPTRETEMVAKAVFAQRLGCLSKEVDDLIDGHADLQAEFDLIMDFVARDALNDECSLGVVDVTFIHLSDLGLVNASPVKVVPGVTITRRSPYQIERALSHKE